MGFETWIQAEDFETGVNFRENMLIGAGKDWCVAVVTEDYFDSPYTTEEWDQAVKANKLIPLCFVPKGTRAEMQLHARLPEASRQLALTSLCGAPEPTMLHGMPGHVQAARLEHAIFLRLEKRAGHNLAHPLIPQGGCTTNLRDVRHRFFFDRPGTRLASLKSALAGERAGSRRMVVICGPSGAGKSWIAEHCGRQLACTASFEAVFILPDASSAGRIDEGLAKLSEWLGAEYSDAVMSAVAQRAQAVLTWLRAHDRWLVIADEVNSEESRRALESRFPASMPGSVLMVTRQTWTDPAAMFPQISAFLPQ